MKTTVPMKDFEERNRSHLGGSDCLLLGTDMSQTRSTCAHRRSCQIHTNLIVPRHLHKNLGLYRSKRQIAEETVTGTARYFLLVLDVEE